MLIFRFSRLLLLCVGMCCLVVAWSTTGRDARGDGLVYQLAQDGTSVKFNLEMERAGGQAKGTLTVSSVGQTVADGEKCRWIEFKMAMGDAGQETIRAKLLVPEKHLGRGQHAYAHVKKGYQQFGGQGVQEIDTKTSRNVGPLPVFLSGRPLKAKELAAAQVDSGLGKLKCKGVRGTLTFQDGPQDINVDIEERLHEKAPFGVVSCTLDFRVSRDGQTQAAGTMRLMLAEVGEGAESEFPDSN